MTSVGAVAPAGSSRRSSSLAPRMACTCTTNGSGFVCIGASREHVDPHTPAALQPESRSTSACRRLRPSRSCPRAATTSAHSCNNSRRHSWRWHAVQASVSDRTTFGVQHADDISAITPPIDTPTTSARSISSSSSTSTASWGFRSKSYGPAGTSEEPVRGCQARRRRCRRPNRPALQRPTTHVHADPWIISTGDRSRPQAPAGSTPILTPSLADGVGHDGRLLLRSSSALSTARRAARPRLGRCTYVPADPASSALGASAGTREAPDSGGARYVRR